MCHLYNSVCNEMDSLLDKKESPLFCSRVLIFYVFDLLFWSSFSTAPSNFWCFCPRGRDTWPTEGLRAWLCRTKKSPKLPTLFRTYLIVPFWYASAAYQASLVEPWFVFWRDVVETKYPWWDQTSLICCRSVLKKVRLGIYRTQIRPKTRVFF